MILFKQEEIIDLKASFAIFNQFQKMPTGIFSLNQPNLNGLHFHFTSSERLKLEKDYMVIVNNKNLAKNKNRIFNSHPKLLLAQLLLYLYNKRKKPELKKYKNNILIDKNAILDQEVSIGPNSIIESGVEVKSGTSIGSNCHIMSGVKMGKSINIDSNCVIGTNGFGYAITKNATMLLRHLGGVRIGNYVDVGAQTYIAAGQIDPTIIEKNVKIDAQVYIGHNAYIKKNSFICAKSVIGGSALIEEGVWVYPNSVISNKVKLGNNVKIGAGSIVLNNVPQFQTYVGNIAENIFSYQRKNYAIKKLIKK